MIRHYLAMTPAELDAAAALPPAVAWMSCRFAPGSSGITGLPRALPRQSLLVLDDSVPMDGQRGPCIARQLEECVQALDCAGVLLDFQRSGSAQAAALAAYLTAHLPCPVGVSALYAGPLDGPVLVPPAPPHLPLGDWLAPWRGRTIWLETALDAQELILTARGAQIRPLPRHTPPPEGFQEGRLHCHYTVAVAGEEARFTLWRTGADVDALLREAEELGVCLAVGLYQELQPLLEQDCSDSPKKCAARGDIPAGR